MNFVYYLHDEPSPYGFEQKLLWFKKRYQLISYQELVNYLYNGAPLKNACHLTVDDGWLSTYRVIFPILKKYNVPMTIFVSPRIAQSGENFWYWDYKNYDEVELRKMLQETGRFQGEVPKIPLELIFKELTIDEVNGLLIAYRKRHNLPVPSRAFVNVTELREMSASGLVEIGAHTMTHPVLARENAERSRQEIQQSVLQLSEMLQTPVTAFAYPNGLRGMDFTQREINYVRQCGIKAAFTVNPGELTSNVNPLDLPRVGSQKRLLLGRIGLRLPSFHDQESPRLKVRKAMK